MGRALGAKTAFEAIDGGFKSLRLCQFIKEQMNTIGKKKPTITVDAQFYHDAIQALSSANMLTLLIMQDRKEVTPALLGFAIELERELHAMTKRHHISLRS